MNQINVLIVDDDIHKVSLIVSTIQQTTKHILSIKQASNVHEEATLLAVFEFHLMITDLQIPLKFDMMPDPNGGKSLLKSIYRKKDSIHLPLYIVGLTGYEGLLENFHNLWQVWLFSAETTDWKTKIRDLIFHIEFVKSRIAAPKIETVFVEGFLDKEILEKALALFYPDLLPVLQIETRNMGGGASWVERQLIIWAKSLTVKKDTEEYLKAVGLFDSDDAGQKAIEKVHDTIKQNSAESKTFSIISCTYKFSPLLKSIYKKGLGFPTSLEEMIGIKFWKVAEHKNWLTRRDINLYKIDPAKTCVAKADISYASLKNEGFSEDEILFTLYKIGDTHKAEFINLICNDDRTDPKDSLLNISFILKDIFEKLKLNMAVA